MRLKNFLWKMWINWRIDVFFCDFWPIFRQFDVLTIFQKKRQFVFFDELTNWRNDENFLISLISSSDTPPAISMLVTVVPIISKRRKVFTRKGGLGRTLHKVPGKPDFSSQNRILAKNGEHKFSNRNWELLYRRSQIGIIKQGNWSRILWNIVFKWYYIPPHF